MMESSNLDLHHQQEIHGGSSSFTSPSFPLLGGLHGWNQDLIVNGGDHFNANASGVVSSSRDFRSSVNEIPAPLGFQDLGFHWTATAESYMNHSADQHQANIARIKDEYLSESYPKLTEFIKSDLQGGHELDERMLLDPASFGDAMANISSMNSVSSSSYPAYMGMDLQALDLLASARFGRSFCEPSLNSMELIGDGIPFGLGRMQGLAQPLNSHHKEPSLVSGVSEAKRGNLEHKASQAAPKKPRFEARSPCTSFKVRKEKLGDRIAALQQLVAPFGKTDTASVLMEAIGYIKFLQEQVETLSVPYMKASNKKLRTTQAASSEDRDEQTQDLSSRGLCLVPLSCTSYVTNDNGGVWSPPNYRGTN